MHTLGGIRMICCSYETWRRAWFAVFATRVALSYTTTTPPPLSLSFPHITFARTLFVYMLCRLSLGDVAGNRMQNRALNVPWVFLCACQSIESKGELAARRVLLLPPAPRVLAHNHYETVILAISGAVLPALMDGNGAANWPPAKSVCVGWTVFKQACLYCAPLLRALMHLLCLDFK